MSGKNTIDESEALTLVYLRNDFYRKKFHLVLATFVLTLFVIAALVGMLVYLKKNPAHPLYFVTDNVGRLIQDISPKQPNMSFQEIENYTVQAVEQAYSYDFINYQEQLQDAQKYFTTYGWRNYMSSLEASNNLLALAHRKMVVVAKVVGPPVLLTQGSLSGAYAWKFQMPMLVTYLLPPYDDKNQFKNPLLVTVIVQRQNVLTSYKGLGVVQSIASIVTNEQQNLNLSSPSE